MSDFEWVPVNSMDEMQAFYLSRLDDMRAAARELGYALGLHGSMRRDFDLIAVPWVDNAADKDDLAATLQMAACGTRMSKYSWHDKPHGRVATSFAVCWPEWHETTGAGCVDLSVMPRTIP